MNCPVCSGKGSVKESRAAGDGTLRRYKCSAGHKWRTLENLDGVYDAQSVHEMRVEAGKRLAAPLIAAKQARLASTGLNKREHDAARRVKAAAFKASREA